MWGKWSGCDLELGREGGAPWKACRHGCLCVELWGSFTYFMFGVQMNVLQKKNKKIDIFVSYNILI